MPKYQAFVYVDDQTGDTRTLSVTVVGDEHVPKNTGLLDAHGTPIYRMPENQPMGYLLPGRHRP